MVSNVGFQNPSSQQKDLRRRQRASSRGLIFAFLLMLTIVGVYAGVYFWEKGVEEKKDALDAKITIRQQEINEILSGPVATFVHKNKAIQKSLHTTASTDIAMRKIQNLMTPRVVLLSIEHEYNESDKTYTIALSGNADNYDVLATQVQAWKNDSAFANVTFGETSRDDADRIVFDARMVLSDTLGGPYDPAPLVETDVPADLVEADTPDGIAEANGI